ncbi:MAG TPA: DNA polymerase III subunit delta [Acidobacteriota bacterium]|nr:DNA polymerase III subunit delta [Acidobacteriota bacterium]
MDLKAFQGSLSDPRPVYFLKSGQDYLRKKVFALCEAQVEEGARSFDWKVFDLASDETSQVVSAARTLPWMGPRRWIWVRNAEQGSEELGRYLKDPAARTVMIVEASRKGKGWPAKLPSLDSESDLPPQQWVRRRARDEGFEMEQAAARRLVELSGEDLQRLDNELEKLFLYTLKDRKITLQAVSDMTLQARDYDVFALIGAVAENDSKKALSILGRLFEAGNTPQAVLAMLYWNFRRLLVAKELLEERRMRFWDVLKKLKIWSYKGKEQQVRRYSRAHLQRLLVRLRETDRLLKSTSSNEKAALERFILEACHAGS